MNQEKEILILVEQCLSGNRKAQEMLFRQLYAFAMKISLRYTGTEADAADVLSHAFTRVFKSMANFDRSKGNFHGWLKRIVINESIDWIKSRTRFSNSVEIEQVEAPIVDNDIIQKMDASELLAIIRMLPPATQTIFNLYAIEGYNHREIATIAGISEGTSKWHLSEARKFLQDKIMCKKNNE